MRVVTEKDLVDLMTVQSLVFQTVFVLLEDRLGIPRQKVAALEMEPGKIAPLAGRPRKKK